jgi:hypothetical protein
MVMRFIAVPSSRAIRRAPDFVHHGSTEDAEFLFPLLFFGIPFSLISLLAWFRVFRASVVKFMLALVRCFTRT